MGSHNSKPVPTGSSRVTSHEEEEAEAEAEAEVDELNNINNQTEAKREEKEETNGNSNGTIPVILHVYKPDPNSTQGSNMPGIYHSGVEVYGSEYFFAGGAGAGGAFRGTGIGVQKPKTQPRGSQWLYDQSIEIAKISKSKTEVRDIVNELRQEFLANSYNLTSRNCNHFSDAFCMALCEKNIPSWVNRLANIGSALGGGFGGGGSNNNNEQKHQQLIKTNAEYAASTYTGPPKPIQEFVPEVKTDFLLKEIDLGKCSGLNVQNNNNNDYVHAIFTQEIGENCKKQPVPLTSDSDEQMLIFIPFKKAVAIESIGLALPYTGSCPKTIKLFINKPHMDFDDANDTTPTDQIQISKKPSGNNNSLSYWVQSFPLKIAKFKNITYLTLFVQDNFEEEASQIYKIELWGRTG